MYGTRYSKTRDVGAKCTACTKLTQSERDVLHYIAVDMGVSDYQLTRQIIRDFIERESSANFAAGIKNNPCA